MLKSLFKKLDLNEKEYLVFISLYKLGSNPASVVANYTKTERTTTYRILKKLSKIGLVSTTHKSNIQYFYVEDEDTIQRFIQAKQQSLQEMESNYDLIRSELKNLKPATLNPPKIKLYENSKNIFSDILNHIKTNKLTTIRLIASETFTEQTGPKQLKDLEGAFLTELKKNKVKVDSLVAEGFLTRERLKHFSNLNTLASLPASNGASNIYLVGDAVFIIIFKERTIGLQIGHSDIAQILHFLFDQLAKQN